MFIFTLAILLARHFACGTVYMCFHTCVYAHAFKTVLCSRIREGAFMQSAACVCVCVFYKLAMEPSGLIMWPGNYTGLSEEVRAA